MTQALKLSASTLLEIEMQISYENRARIAVQLATNIEDPKFYGYQSWVEVYEALTDGVVPISEDDEDAHVCYPFEAFFLDAAVEVAYELVDCVLEDVLKMLANK